eukprot:scaffold33274_cov31-Prasinocladus_malaysianus.AAC.1
MRHDERSALICAEIDADPKLKAPIPLAEGVQRLQRPRSPQYDPLDGAGAIDTADETLSLDTDELIEDLAGDLLYDTTMDEGASDGGEALN